MLPLKLALLDLSLRLSYHTNSSTSRKEKETRGDPWFQTFLCAECEGILFDDFDEELQQWTNEHASECVSSSELGSYSFAAGVSPEGTVDDMAYSKQLALAW